MSKYQAYEKYKDSGIEWLGDIPEHWKSLKIKRLTSIKRGASPRPIDDPKYFDDDGEYAWVRIADVTASDHYLEKTTQRLSKLGKSFSVPLEVGDLFLSIAGSVGKPMIANIKCCIHDGFVYFPDLNINRKFIYYIFYSGQPYLGLGKLGTQLNLNTETVGAITIGLPPLEEQETIARFLDHKTKQIDDLIAKKEALLEKLDEKRTALITHAVTKGLDPTAPMKDSGIKWLGDIPEHWEIKKAKYVYSQASRPIPKSSGVVTAYRDGQVTLRENRRADGYTFAIKEVGYQGVKKGDLVIQSMDAFAGAIGVSESDGRCSPEYVICEPFNPETSNNYYASLLRCMAQRDYIYVICPSVRERAPRFRFSTFKELEIPIPPFKEQLDITQFFMISLEDQLLQVKKIKEAIEKLKEYRTALITNAVTGKIDVRHIPIPQP
ncbi:restriction endonuclease subunit S [Roseofilum sp. BLCC_M91]|uniref:Restriction endonuclease subunit S n=1 Tax=Roseofilum halophilum BLCC-M91 TaxID=3022259 RepID=A0ABT7BGW4_9CYAN|nr:restriction endonuclease subunit S [Roseofilum halophilum]MDJ1177518.1 restriction endonuclease subunit S [Roseofilum halophilum BLCC-M91]